MAFFRDLFDFSFSRMVALRIIRVLYALAMAGAAIWAIVLIAGAFATSPGYGVLMLLIGAPLVFLLIVIYVRLGLEVMSATIRLASEASDIKRLLQKRNTTAGSTPPDGIA